MLFLMAAVISNPAYGLEATPADVWSVKSEFVKNLYLS
jgi:hypothetical protein